MRYIGNKENLIPILYEELVARKIAGESFFDFFSGTASVGKFFKKKGYRTLSSDLMYFSYCLQNAYLKNNVEPEFKGVLNVIENISINLIETNYDLVLNYLNTLEGIDGFLYNNYTPGGTKKLDVPRMYLSDENGRKIDHIRTVVETWNEKGLLEANEYYILLATLIESISFFTNVSGVYGAFHKKWDPRALKTFEMRPIEIITSEKEHETNVGDSMELVENIDVDILYLDPPYNERQYAPNYHLIETLAKYDNPKIRGITGMRNYDDQKSNWCNKNAALEELEEVASKARYKYLLLSYNSEGIMERNLIKEILSKYGTVEVVEVDYARYKSNNRGKSRTKRSVVEHLFILNKNK